MGNFYITEVEKPHPQMHDAKVIMHRSWDLRFEDFRSMKELDDFAKLLDFKYELVHSFYNGVSGKVNKYAMSHYIDDPFGRSFWDLSQIPKGAKKVKLMDNGHMVTCYFINDGSIIHLYRPNPNVKELHKLY